MIFDDKAKDLLKAILMEEMMEDHPAEIRAKMENCLINYTFSGRGRDVLALAIEIAEKTAKKLEISYDDFCKMLKIRWNQEDSIVEKKFKDIFGDLFKD
ncbi:MAG: hypothetical protein VZR06_00165 [Butyrivibrio sp.]|nr:hypothetical protein [Butyrivibrio sp.]